MEKSTDHQVFMAMIMFMGVTGKIPAASAVLFMIKLLVRKIRMRKYII